MRTERGVVAKQATKSHGLQIKLFGTFEVLHAGAPASIGRRLERCLLGILALEAGRNVSLDRISALLWDEQAPADPRATLHTYVCRLRSALANGLGRACHIVSAHGAGGYRLELDSEIVDVLRFRSLIREAREIAAPDTRARVLRSAVALRRGPLLDDVATAPVRSRLAASLDEAWLAAYEDAIDADLAAGQHRNLVPELTELAAEYPFREEFTAQLMRALHRSGRTVDALGVYAVAESRTRALLGTTPGQQLRHLRGAILYGPAQPAPVSYQPEATA